MRRDGTRTVRRDVPRSTPRFSADEAPNGPMAVGTLGELPYSIGAQIGNEELGLGRVEWVEHGLVGMGGFLSG